RQPRGRGFPVFRRGPEQRTGWHLRPRALCRSRRRSPRGKGCDGFPGGSMTATKRTTLAAGLCLLVAGFLFFRPARDPQAGASWAGTSRERLGTLTSDGISPSVATTAPAGPTGAAPSPRLPASVATAAPLPPAPSGDYELNLTD